MAGDVGSWLRTPLRYDGLGMNEDVFWELIAKLDWAKTGDDEAVIRPVVNALAKRSVEDIFRFHDLLAEKIHAIDGEVYARSIGEDSYRGENECFSVDNFLYVRCCVVANGRALFNRVLSDPTAMPKGLEFEALLTVPEEAFSLKTKGDEYPHLAEPDFETFANRAGWASSRGLGNE
jgi:hypothetical protein